MGVLLDAAAYDLATAHGQADALQDMLDAHNDQFDRSQALQAFRIVAYQQLTLHLVNGNPTGTYQTSYQHGLGYAPLAFGFNLIAGGTYYNNAAYVELAFAAPNPINTYTYTTVDANNVYLNVFARNISGSFSSTDFAVGIYIFNVPALIG